MYKTLKEEILDMKNKTPNGYICFFNDGTTSKDEEKTIESLELKSPAIFRIKDLYQNAAKSYINKGYDFDTIEMDLKMGIIYKEVYVNEDNTIKEGNKPLDKYVRIYTGRIKSYLDENQTNESDYYEYGVNYQGVEKYNLLLDEIEASGLKFIGPEKYEDFKEKILNGETFEIKLSLSLIEQQELEKEENKTNKIKKLIRR